MWSVIFDDSSSLDPSSAVSCLSFQSCHFLTSSLPGEDKMAVDHYRQAIRLKPTHYIAMVNLGRLLRLNNKNQDAEFWYKR